MGFSAGAGGEPGARRIVTFTGAGVVAVLGVIGLLSTASHRAARLLRFSPGQRERYLTYDTAATGVLLLTLVGSVGVHFQVSLLLLLGGLLVAAKILALVVAADPWQRAEVTTSRPWLAFLFLVSGFAALIYQIVWERALFAAFGVNIESITLIVSLFMFGLGLGSLAGGIVADRHPDRVPQLFLACELAIGVFGVASLSLIRIVSGVTVQANLLVTSLAIFALLCVPTLLMGATLPILVTHLYRHYRNLGQSVGLLYSINTVGSAIACFITADLLFVLLGMRGAVYTAAACNLVVGVLVYRYAKAIGHRADGPAAPADAPDDAPEPAAAAPAADRRRAIRTAFILLFAAATGYISLSQEMLWMRLIGYATGGMPGVFAHVLGCFLLGVAGGALVGQRLCATRFDRRGPGPVYFIAACLLISALVYHLSIAGVARLMTASAMLATASIYLTVTVVSFLLGGIFTVLCHHARRADQSAGVTVSRVYLANIVGCTAGPLLTGFVLMNHLPTDRLILYLSVATALLAGVAFLAVPGRRPVALVACGVAALLPVIHPAIYDDLLARFQFKADYAARAPRPYAILAENRSGVIAVSPDPLGDVIYGGGMYDGRFTIDPVADANLIHRCYMVAGIHPAPADVLEIGLSSASWTRVLANDPRVRRVTTVEINPGYISLLRGHADQYPDQSSVLDDPKCRHVIDDGRRWLNRNPERRFDLILQNTTWHWRAEITNLLSREYLELCKRHLNPGGVLYYNTTGSEDIRYTAAQVFKHVVRISSFVAASDAPFTLTPSEIAANLRAYQQNGRPTFAAADDPVRQHALDQVVDSLSHLPLTDIAPALRARRGLLLITDDNMTTEFKRNGQFDRAELWNPRRTWRAFMSRAAN